MGLDQPPPYCQVGVTGDEASRLLQVTPDELQRLQLPRRPSIGVAASTSAAQEPSPRGVAPVAWMREQPSGGGGAAASTSSSSALSSLQVENARLRAELASHIALDCIRAAEAAVQAPPVPSPAPSAPPSPRPMDGSMGVAAPSAAAGIIPAHQSQAQGLPLGPDAAIKFELALAAKDALLREQAAAAAGEAASLRERVAQLEAQLAARSLHSAQSSGADASMTTVKPGEQLDPGEVHMKPSEDREASQVAGSQEEGGNPAAHGESSCE